MGVKGGQIYIGVFFRDENNEKSNENFGNNITDGKTFSILSLKLKQTF